MHWNNIRCDNEFHSTLKYVSLFDDKKCLKMSVPACCIYLHPYETVCVIHIIILNKNSLQVYSIIDIYIYYIFIGHALIYTFSSSIMQIFKIWFLVFVNITIVTGHIFIFLRIFILLRECPVPCEDINFCSFSNDNPHFYAVNYLACNFFENVYTYQN